MRKIPTLYLRDFNARPAHVTTEPNPECAWVLAGEGIATRKWDGTCTMRDEAGAWWARREVKQGKTPPPHFVTVVTDDETGRTVGWEPMEQASFAKYHAEALAYGGTDRPGTYELLGPRINGNPDGFMVHILMFHGWAPLDERVDLEAAPRDYEGLRVWLASRPYEGIVFHHDDGRMAKIKRKDFPA
ncbi:hypothetical protein ACFY0G_02220 [Streptomyces sp. NPDC001552]|uniref:hypothetical protein n=1 Tax=Streptomyces sp. NPDC001552 TaxID=3364587 RepID=UPI0036A19E2B